MKQGFRVQPNFSMVRQKKLRSHQCDQLFKKKNGLHDSESLPVVQQQTHIRPISWSKPNRDSERWTPPLIGRGPDIPVRVCTSDREASSRDARSVANLATLSLDLATFQTPLATFFTKKSDKWQI